MNELIGKTFQSTFHTITSAIISVFGYFAMDLHLAIHCSYTRIAISLSPVLARYDPFGVDVPLNFDNTHSPVDRKFNIIPPLPWAMLSPLLYH